MKKRENSEPGARARDILAKNLRDLMEKSHDLDSHAKIAKRAKVGDGSIGFMLSPKTGNPTLHNVAKVAKAFGLEAWQILHPDMPTRVLTAKEMALYDSIKRAYDELPLKVKV